MLLAHGFERIRIRRFDADEDGEELRLAHQRQNLRLLGEIERRLAGELQRIAVLALPGDQMRQHLARRLAVADEIVVDEIDHRRMRGLRHHGVELGGNLLRCLQTRLPAVKRGDVAELAAIWTAAGELQTADQITAEADQIVGRQREVGQRQALVGFEPLLRRGRHDTVVEAGNKPVGGVADLADVEVIEVRIKLGRAGDRGAAQHRDLACRLGARGDIVHLRRLDMHAADHDDIGPGEIGSLSRRDILVDKAHRPGRRQVGGDQQEPLRRHEGAHPVHQTKGVGKRAERGRVSREDAKDASFTRGR